MSKCLCGCGNEVKPGNKYIRNHAPLKGKTYKEYFGEKRAKEISDKIAITKIGDRNPAKRLDVREIISKNRKGKLTGDDNPSYWKSKKNPGQSLRMKNNNPSKTPEKREAMRISVLNNFIKRGSVKIGKNETQILNEIEKILNYKIIRQHQIKEYAVDGYIKELNLIIEIDEPHHYKATWKLREKDVQRQSFIENKLNCKILRIKDNISFDELKEKLINLK